MKKETTYPNIDMEKTGLLLKSKLESAGYTPKMTQEYLHLSCPQPVYRWFKGKILPSVDHLLMLSELLDVHMEELLVKRQRRSCEIVIGFYKHRHEAEHLVEYYNKIKSVA